MRVQIEMPTRNKLLTSLVVWVGLTFTVYTAMAVLTL